MYIYICVLVSLQILPKTGSELASTERHSTFAPCNNLEAFHPWHQRPRSTAVTKKSQVELRGHYKILQVFTRGVLKKTQVIVIVVIVDLGVWVSGISLWRFHLESWGFCVHLFSLKWHTFSVTVWNRTFVGSSRTKKPGQRDPSSGQDLYVSLLQLHICWPQASRAERQHEITSKTH